MLKAVALAVAVLNLIGSLSPQSRLTLLGIRLFCLAVASVMNEPNGGSSKK